MKAFVLLAGTGLLAAAVPALAHHALNAQYDTRQTITVKGTVTKVDWSNPHGHLYVHSMDESPGKMDWALEMASPNILMLNGLKVDNLRKGDYVIVQAYPSKAGGASGYATKVTLTTR